MANRSKTPAREVHGLLLEAHPEADNDNLVKAAHIAETASAPRDHRQLETFVAIRNLRTAVESGAGAAELESLLLHAVDGRALGEQKMRNFYLSLVFVGIAVLAFAGLLGLQRIVG